VRVHLRDAELLAEMRGVLVDREAGREGRDLEQDAPRAEVDRAEVVAVLDAGDVAAGVADPLPPGGLFVVLGRPGDVVDGAGARQPVRSWLVVGPAEAPLATVEPVLAAAEVGEGERLGQERLFELRVRGVGGGAFDAGDRELGRDLGVLGPKRRVAVVSDDELDPEPFPVSANRSDRSPRLLSYPFAASRSAQNRRSDRRS
jgi:hypothetical protein